MRLKGRRILITGGAKGIGLATAKLFAAEGAKLALLDYDAGALATAAEATRGTPLACDLSDIKATEQAVERAAGAMGGIDGVVSCAAISVPRPLSELTIEHWQKTIAINLTGTFVVCKAAVPWLQKNEWATIVNVASAQALLPTAGAGIDYAASKGGVLLFSKMLATELAPKIRVNVVCPGITDTPMVQTILENQDPKLIEGVYATNMIKRPSTADEQARGILFLTSEESSFVDGIALAIDGGRSRH
jgi:NAD(P)-dependent dehydrogenase (short-subunit alcohol dehydrogenase family)